MDHWPNVRPKTIKVLENKKENLCDFRLGKNFLDMTQMVWPKNLKTDKLDFIKIWNFCSLKKCEKTRRKWKKKICKVLRIFAHIQKVWIFNIRINMKRHFTWWITNKQMKRCSILLITGEMQITATMICQYTPVRTAKTQRTNSIKCWWECRESGTLYTTDGRQDSTDSLENSCWIVYYVKYVFPIRSRIPTPDN